MENIMENITSKTSTMTNFRWKIAFLIFLISFVAYMDRVNLSVATPVIMQEFGFTKIDMGFIQTCFFAGYALMQVPGGMLAEKLGFRRTGALAILWWSVFTVLTALSKGKFSFAVIRFMFGIGEGPVFPSLGSATFKWFNSKEKGSASSSILLGTFFGPVVGPAVTVALMAAFGWHIVFVLFGLVGALLAWVWFHFAKDTPSDSPYVNNEEAIHINDGRLSDTDNKKTMAPWGKFLRSSQFWAVGLQFCVIDYIMYVFLAWLPLYLTETQGFSLTKMGIWASFPWIALMAVVFLAGYISDKFAKSANSNRQYTMRTITAIIGVVICSFGLYIASHTANPIMNIIWMSVSLGSLGLTFSAGWSTVISLGGKYTGSVSGWMNFWGNIGGVLAPIVTAFLVTNYGWNQAFTATSLFGIIAIVAWIFVKPGNPLVSEDVTE
ncbi:MFS transporter [Megasphaera paucivorans]|uniref:MFS transporter, ACS family, glucarate transporter n=1 Tax=Megasphaera paucivorans TaxID=349095 RepID=A0A1G9R5K4_9FIRM|nr:MFS transporter [Megasphaera paucivorans]SDM18390.1 MFS transporter, ACS family, glucarate transporter [Megasphaera paucivorans]